MQVCVLVKMAWMYISKYKNNYVGAAGRTGLTDKYDDNVKISPEVI